MSKITLLVTAIAGIALAAGQARAQTQEPRKDAQSSYEPRSRPGAGQKYLESFVGDWDVIKVFHPRSGGEPVRTPGTCRQTKFNPTPDGKERLIMTRKANTPRAVR